MVLTGVSTETYLSLKTKVKAGNSQAELLQSRE